MNKLTYYHGGIPGLKEGDYILPPKKTGTAHTLFEYAKEYCEESGAELRQKEDLVYVTTDIHAASCFAGLYPGGGWLYLVTPEEPMEHDADCNETGLSFQCPRAKILKRIIED